jgi:hypothetical protein
MPPLIIDIPGPRTPTEGVERLENNFTPAFGYESFS